MVYKLVCILDIECEDTLCNKARWADPSWADGHIPDIITQGAPLKDTVFVPAGGYIVIRFLADNPGTDRSIPRYPKQVLNEIRNTVP